MPRSSYISIIQAIPIAVQHLTFANNVENCAEGDWLRALVLCGLFHANHHCCEAAHTRL
jgi:hypothetical protein